MALLGNFCLLLAGLLLIMVPYVRSERQCEAYHLKENSEKTVELTETEAWTDSRCDLFAKSSKDDVFTLTGQQPSNWPQDAFCLAASYPNLGSTYEFDVDMWNHIGKERIEDGFPGIAFNVKDEKHYDFIFFRLRDSVNSYQTGYVRKGIIKLVKIGACPDGPPQGRTWFNVKLNMMGEEAVVTLDGRVVVKFSPHSDRAGNVGVLLANGFDNQIRFKNPSVTGAQILVKPMPVIGPKSCKISDKKASDFTVKYGDVKNTSEIEFVFTAAATYDRAITKQFYRAFNNYWISVDMLFPSPHWAGVIVNARDVDNFEEVMLACPSEKRSYSYLFVNGKQTKSQRFDSPTNNLPSCSTWYNVMINVKGEQVTLYVDDVLIWKYDSLRRPGGHVGIFNGSDRQKVRFRNFEVHVPAN